MARRKKADVIRENEERLLWQLGFAERPWDPKAWYMGLSSDGTFGVVIQREGSGFVVAWCLTGEGDGLEHCSACEHADTVEEAVRLAMSRFTGLIMNLAGALYDLQDWDGVDKARSKEFGNGRKG